MSNLWNEYYTIRVSFMYFNLRWYLRMPTYRCRKKLRDPRIKDPALLIFCRIIHNKCLRRLFDFEALMYGAHWRAALRKGTRFLK